MFFYVWLVQIASGEGIGTKTSFYVVPSFGYQPETNWMGGASGALYLKSKDASKISSVSGIASYTLNDQFYFQVVPRLYFFNNQSFLYSSLGAKSYPDTYYGVTNSISELEIPYVAQSVKLLLEPQYILSKTWYLGASFVFRKENIVYDSIFELKKPNIADKFGLEGWSPFSVAQLGLLATFDSRDNHFYPHKGVFLKAVFHNSSSVIGSSYDFNDLSFDYRQYVTLQDTHILAWQIYLFDIFSEKALPFQLLPTLGGIDRMRGFLQGQFLGSKMFHSQVEYRFPIFGRLRGCLFGGMGDVFRNYQFETEKLKVSYGLGFRYRINNAKVNLRFDIAKNNYDGRIVPYLTVSEAF